ncbi:MAG: hypothetical protein KGK08_05475 [Acidobacteriota bacterium]|nr:hypothetical protein [Acidobacteriota bacterium]
MDSRGLDKVDDLPLADTPEDVAVLYSWANLHGAKYRDFSASRREYRAQLRHRAAEQTREQELKAKAEAEAAAAAAEEAARRAEEAARQLAENPNDVGLQNALREAGRASRIAMAERVEAARRAEAAALAEAAARREEREIAEANASARRQAERYQESEIRMRKSGIHRAAVVPGQISDPYTQPVHPIPEPPMQTLPPDHFERSAPPEPQLRPAAPPPEPPAAVQPVPFAVPPAQPVAASAPEPPPAPVAPVQAVPTLAPLPPAEPRRGTSNFSSVQRRRGYRPDDASGVREIYRGPEFDAPQGEYVASEPVRPLVAADAVEPQRPDPWTNKVPQPAEVTQRATPAPFQEQLLPPAPPVAATPRPVAPRATSFDSPAFEVWPASEASEPAPRSRRESTNPSLTNFAATRGSESSRGAGSYQSATPRVPMPAPDAGRGRRAGDDQPYVEPPQAPPPSRRGSSSGNRTAAPSMVRPAYTPDPTGPAWLYAPQATQQPSSPSRQTGAVSSIYQSSVADTLQYSRERVAARWYALKGVFEQPGQEQPEAPVRQKEVRTPVLAVFSLAGGVGKTSLVATLGRALSSMGEKVLLTDTTSHGLLPFYFGASELRHGVVRTFSPPSGSTDAPIYLVSYDVDQHAPGEEVENQLVEEIVQSSKGTHRILLDLTPGSGWVVRRLARRNPIILVPVAPDMNSVISLQSVEKYFHGVVDADGRPLQPYYILNQFDASLPLHLDVREVLRRQLSDRLLPFVIRRAPAVSEALAEGMTVIDYAPDAPVVEDYQNIANWLRSIAAPATAGFRNVRWSER